METKTKFTPGSWKVESYKEPLMVTLRTFQVVAADYTIVAQCGYGNAEVVANANLIAASPKMYELLDVLCKLDEAEVFVKEPWEVTFKEARELLAKIRGEDE